MLGRILTILPSYKWKCVKVKVFYAGLLRTHLKTHSEKSQINVTSNTKVHLKMHSGEKSNNCNLCDYASWLNKKNCKNLRGCAQTCFVTCIQLFICFARYCVLLNDISLYYMVLHSYIQKSNTMADSTVKPKRFGEKKA